MSWPISALANRLTLCGVLMTVAMVAALGFEAIALAVVFGAIGAMCGIGAGALLISAGLRR